jgi:hypothetical protein
VQYASLEGVRGIIPKKTKKLCEVSYGDFSEGRGRKVELIAGRVWIDLYLRDGENPVSKPPPEVLKEKRH